MTKAEYLAMRAREYGITPFFWREFDQIGDESDAFDYACKAGNFTSSIARHMSKLQEERKTVDWDIYQIQKKMPELKKQSEIAKQKIQTIKEEVKLADCLTRFDKMGVSTSDPLFNLKFTFQHHLDIAKPFLRTLYGKPVDIDKVITDPNYLDELIFDDPKAVYLRGFLFMVAEGAYEQHQQPIDAFDFIANNPHISNDSVEVILVSQFDVYNNTYVHERMYFYLEYLQSLMENDELIDERTNGHHLHYLMLPTVNLHNALIDVFGTDKDGNFFTEEEKESYFSSLASRPMLSVDFGQKNLIRLTEPFLNFQERSGKVKYDHLSYGHEDIVEQYHLMVK